MTGSPPAHLNIVWAHTIPVLSSAAVRVPHHLGMVAISLGIPGSCSSGRFSGRFRRVPRTDRITTSGLGALRMADLKTGGRLSEPNREDRRNGKNRYARHPGEVPLQEPKTHCSGTEGQRCRVCRSEMDGVMRDLQVLSWSVWPVGVVKYHDECGGSSLS